MVSLLHLSHSDGYEVLLQCVLICIPMMTNEVATLFIGHLDILFYEVPVEDFAHFLMFVSLNFL